MKVVPDDMTACPLTGFPSGPQSTTMFRVIRNRKMVSCVAKTIHSYSVMIRKHAHSHRLIYYRATSELILLTNTGRCSR